MIEPVYNYIMLSNYNATQPTKYRSHRTNELKDIYNRIVTISKQSPLYLVSMSPFKQEYTINIKEDAISLYNLTSSFLDTTTDSIFHSKTAVTSNEDVIVANIIKEDKLQFPQELTIKVNQLALAQINEGKEVNSEQYKLKQGAYSFNVHIDEEIYEFNYNNIANTPNVIVQTKLASFINQANIGIAAHVSKVNEITSKLILQSNSTGCLENLIFTLEDTAAPNLEEGLVSYFNLNDITQYPQNSQFEINGVEKESLSNEFVLNQCIQIHLLSPSTDEINIHYVPDTSSILSSMRELKENYNKLVSYSDNPPKEAHTSMLILELTKLTSAYQNELDSIGLSLNENGYLDLDESLVFQAIEDGLVEHYLSEPEGFMKRLGEKSKDIMLNPIEYIDKKIVSYPNYSKFPFANPYITSVYSGLFYNYYC